MYSEEIHYNILVSNTCRSVPGVRGLFSILDQKFACYSTEFAQRTFLPHKQLRFINMIYMPTMQPSVVYARAHGFRRGGVVYKLRKRWQVHTFKINNNIHKFQYQQPCAYIIITLSTSDIFFKMRVIIHRQIANTNVYYWIYYYINRKNVIIIKRKLLWLRQNDNCLVYYCIGTSNNLTK